MMPARKRSLLSPPIALAICLVAAAFGPAAPEAAGPAETRRSEAKSSSAGGKPALNQVRIHSLYNEGDFDRVIALIDSFTAGNKSYSREDSVFIAKHLAVVYTANPATREKGKGYMFQLLDLMPSAKIVDMFVSDEIDRIFERVKEEYQVRAKLRGNGPAGDAETSRYALDRMKVREDSSGPQGPARSGREPKPAGSKAKFWIAGGLVFAAAAGTASWYFLKPEDGKDKVYDLP